MGWVSITCQICLKSTALDQLLFCTAQGESHPRLQCRNCSRTQVDAYLCYTCSDSVFSSTAHKQRYSCLRCLTCPMCNCNLKVRSESGLYTYRCVFCYWEWAQQSASEQDLLSSCTAAIDAALETERCHLARLGSRLQPQEGREETRSDQTEIDTIGSDSTADRWVTSPVLQSGTLSRWMSPLDPYRGLSEMIPNRQLLVPRTSVRCSICNRFLIKPSSDLFSSSFDKNALASSCVPKISYINNLLLFENQTRHTLTIKVDSREILLKPYDKIQSRREAAKVREGEDQSDTPAPWASQLIMPDFTTETIETELELTVEDYHIEKVTLKLIITRKERESM